MAKSVINYQVVRGFDLYKHESHSDHAFLFMARAERDLMNDAYQTNEYRVLEHYDDGTRGWAR